MKEHVFFKRNPPGVPNPAERPDFRDIGRTAGRKRLVGEAERTLGGACRNRIGIIAVLAVFDYRTASTENSPAMFADRVPISVRNGSPPARFYRIESKSPDGEGCP